MDYVNANGQKTYYTGWSCIKYRKHDDAIATLSAIPEDITHVNLGNDIFSHMSYLEAKRYMEAIPSTVTHVAYQNNVNGEPIFIPKEDINREINAFIDYSFYLKCFGALSVITGSAIALLGVVCLLPVVTTVGVDIALLGAGVISCMFFKGAAQQTRKIVPDENNGCTISTRTPFDSVFWERSPFTS